MTPGARAAAAIEILDAALAGRNPAEEEVRTWGRAHRFAGSKDRRAIADLVYDALRLRAWSEWRFEGADGRRLLLGLHGDAEAADRIFTGEVHAPSPLTDAERSAFARDANAAPPAVRAGAPAWLAPSLERAFGPDWREEAEAAGGRRAPVDLRVNALAGDLEGALRLLAHEDVRPERTPHAARGLRLPADWRRDVHQLKAYQTGWIEVQDEGSQIAALLAAARPGERVVDYCAGAGGKTLALMAEMGGRGRLVAADVSRARLDRMSPRLERARAKIERRVLGPAGEGLEDLALGADLVFVDAPCSGSGTWRRRPEAAFRLEPEALERLGALQRRILRDAARLVRPGGRLVYVTCSLLPEENQDVARDFEAAAAGAFRPRPLSDALASGGFRPEGAARLAALCGPGHSLQLTPRRTATDGFFIASFQRTGPG